MGCPDARYKVMFPLSINRILSPYLPTFDTLNRNSDGKLRPPEISSATKWSRNTKTNEKIKGTQVPHKLKYVQDQGPKLEPARRVNLKKESGRAKTRPHRVLTGGTKHTERICMGNRYKNMNVQSRPDQMGDIIEETGDGEATLKNRSRTQINEI